MASGTPEALNGERSKTWEAAGGLAVATEGRVLRVHLQNIMSDVFQMYFSWFLFFYYYTTEVVTLLSLFCATAVDNITPVSSFLSGHTLWEMILKVPST